MPWTQLLAVCSDLSLGLIAYSLVRKLSKSVELQTAILKELTGRVERLERASTNQGG